jgi:hypothetical protein
MSNSATSPQIITQISLLATIGVGVIAGAIASAFVFFIQVIWKRIIEPWYEKRVYKDAKIDGVWEGKIATLCDTSGEYKEQITLEQIGHQVKGRILCTAGIDLGKEYALEASFKNLILSGTYSQKDPKSLDRGSFSFKLVENGNKLKGYTSFYYTPEDRINYSEYIWERKKLVTPRRNNSACHLQVKDKEENKS